MTFLVTFSYLDTGTLELKERIEAVELNGNLDLMDDYDEIEDYLRGEFVFLDEIKSITKVPMSFRR